MDSRTVVVFLVGLLLGWGIGWLLHPIERNAEPPGMAISEGTEQTPAPEAGPALSSADQPRVQAPSRPPTTAPETTGPETTDPKVAAPATTHPSTEALVTARTEQIRRAAAESIAREQERAASAEALARAQIARELAAEEARLGDLQRGGLLDLVRKLGDDWQAPIGLLSSAEQMAAFFQRREKGGTLDVGRANASTGELAHGDTILVAAGAWQFDSGKLGRRGGLAGFPRDLLFEGAGMDRSLLVLNDEFDVSGDVVNLTFRDLTIHCNDNYFVQFRRGFTLRLERCRIIGFDMGAGGSTAFNGRDGAVFATGCRFESGFGRSPYRGNLWRVRGTLLARIEDCTVVGPIDDVWPRGSESLIAYERTRFVDVDEKQVRRHETRKNLLLLDCIFEKSTVDDGTPQSGNARRRGKQRDVAELNPDWVPRNWR